MRLHMLGSATVVALATLSPLQGAAAQKEFHWRGRIAAGKSIEIKGVNGDVSAVPGSGETEVSAVKRAKRSDPDEVKIEVVEHADGVTICAVYPSDGRRENTCEPGEGGHGELEAANLASDVDASTVNGSIRISTSGVAEATTVNGSITASMGRANWTDGLEFRTVNGGITLDLPAGLSTEVRAETVNGDILTDFPLTVTGRLGPRRLRGTIGSGGRELALSTVNGSIKLRKSS